MFSWIKRNKLSTVLLLILASMFLSQIFTTMFGVNTLSSGSSRIQTYPEAGGLTYSKSYALPSVDMALPPVESDNRIVIQDTSLSLQVENVPQVIKQIHQLTTAAKGFMVSSDLSIPEADAVGTITIRVPENNRDSVLADIKALGLKTVSETVHGQDVTDRYVDNDARLETLTKTKAKFEAIMEQSVRIQDILEVQRELINLQSQIDNLKGQQQYLEQSSRLTKITIHLSTDEYALPYTPTESWRAEVIFKQAVRSLIGTLRSFGTLGIWLVVYAPIWLIFITLVWLIKRRRTR
jgi:hypothetical protein